MKKVPVSILCGIVAMLVTIIAYFVIIGNIFAQMICFITLIGVVISEGVVTALAYLSKGEPRKVGATIVAGFMVPVSVILSVVYIVNFPFGYGAYAGWYVSALALTLVIVAIIWKFADSRKEENDDFQNAKANMLRLRNVTKCIMLKDGAKNFKKELEDIEEKLHYSNDAVITAADSKIGNMLSELDAKIDDEEFDAAGLIKEITAEIDRRNIFTK